MKEILKIHKLKPGNLVRIIMQDKSYGQFMFFKFLIEKKNVDFIDKLHIKYMISSNDTLLFIKTVENYEVDLLKYKNVYLFLHKNTLIFTSSQDSRKFELLS